MDVSRAIDSVVVAHQPRRCWEIPHDSLLNDPFPPSRSVSSASMSSWDEDMLRAAIQSISTPSPLQDTSPAIAGETVPMPESSHSSSENDNQEPSLPHPSHSAHSTFLLPGVRKQDAETKT